MTKPNRIDPKKCMRLKEDGWTWAAIAKKYGFNPGSVAMAVKAYKDKMAKYTNADPDVLPPVEILEDILEEKERKTHPPTKPWDANNNPWSLDLLRLKIKRPGWRPRFVNRDNLQVKQDQGWTVADVRDYGGLDAKLPGEEGQLDTAIKRRELVLMEMPEELFEQRQKFYEKKTDSRSISAREIAATEAARMRQSGVDMGLVDEGTPLRERINQLRRTVA